MSETHVHYVVCRATSASTNNAHPCTFHTHPTDLEGTEPDLPSASDVYSFLKWRHQRAVTVGRELIWVFDKTIETVPVIEKLSTWERENMISTFHKLDRQRIEDISRDYMIIALNAIGLAWPKLAADVESDFRNSWCDLLEERLSIAVNCFKKTLKTRPENPTGLGAIRPNSFGKK